MQIANLLSEGRILFNYAGTEKKKLLDELISLLADELDEETVAKVREAVHEREAIMSTGVGKGLAIPHGKVKGLDQNYAAFALLKEPISYQAIDERPVKMVFLLVGPESAKSLHIKLLSRISRLMNNGEFRDQIQSCSSKKELIETFQVEEQKHLGR